MLLSLAKTFIVELVARLEKIYKQLTEVFLIGKAHRKAFRVVVLGGNVFWGVFFIVCSFTVVSVF